MRTPIIMIAEAGSRAAIDAIGEALGRGPTSVIVPMIADPAVVGYDADTNGPWPDPPTHFGGFDDSTEKPIADVWLAVSNGILPEELPGGREWGVNGVISYEDAMAAVTPTGKFLVFECSASVDPVPAFWGFAAGDGIYPYPFTILW